MVRTTVLSIRCARWEFQSCHTAHAQMTKSDYKEYDYLIGMDEWNIRNMKCIAGEDSEGKIHMLLEFSDEPRAIADPWYTGNFDVTYADVVEGCEAFFEYLKEQGKI